MNVAVVRGGKSYCGFKYCSSNNKNHFKILKLNKKPQTRHALSNFNKDPPRVTQKNQGKIMYCTPDRQI